MNNGRLLEGNKVPDESDKTESQNTNVPTKYVGTWYLQNVETVNASLFGFHVDILCF